MAHSFTDLLISETIPPETKREGFQILVRVIENKKESAYIPGETLQAEQQRAKMMLFGVVPLCLHLVQSEADKPESTKLAKMAKEHLIGGYTTGELEWNRELMQKMGSVAAAAPGEVKIVSETKKKYFEDGIFAVVFDDSNTQKKNSETVEHAEAKP